MGQDALLLFAVGGWMETTVQEQKIFDLVGFSEDGIAVCSALKQGDHFCILMELFWIVGTDWRILRQLYDWLVGIYVEIPAHKH